MLPYAKWNKISKLTFSINSAYITKSCWHYVENSVILQHTKFQDNLTTHYENICYFMYKTGKICKTEKTTKQTYNSTFLSHLPSWQHLYVLPQFRIVLQHMQGHLLGQPALPASSAWLLSQHPSSSCSCPVCISGCSARAFLVVLPQGVQCGPLPGIHKTPECSGRSRSQSWTPQQQWWQQMLPGYVTQNCLLNISPRPDYEDIRSRFVCGLRHTSGVAACQPVFHTQAPGAGEEAWSPGVCAQTCHVGLEAFQQHRRLGKNTMSPHQQGSTHGEDWHLLSSHGRERHIWPSAYLPLCCCLWLPCCSRFGVFWWHFQSVSLDRVPRVWCHASCSQTQDYEALCLIVCSHGLHTLLSLSQLHLHMACVGSVHSGSCCLHLTALWCIAARGTQQTGPRVWWLLPPPSCQMNLQHRQWEQSVSCLYKMPCQFSHLHIFPLHIVTPILMHSKATEQIGAAVKHVIYFYCYCYHLHLQLQVM